MPEGTWWVWGEKSWDPGRTGSFPLRGSGRAPHTARQAGAAWASQGSAGERALTQAHSISRASFPAILMLVNEPILHRQGSHTQCPHVCVWKVLLRSLIYCSFTLG